MEKGGQPPPDTRNVDSNKNTKDAASEELSTS